MSEKALKRCLVAFAVVIGIEFVLMLAMDDYLPHRCRPASVVALFSPCAGDGR